MNDIIFTLGKLSLQGSVVILVVFVIRFLFDKFNMPKKYISILWFVPFICLILPWRIESDLSFWQLFEADNEAVSVLDNVNKTGQNDEIHNGINIDAIENQVNSNNSVNSDVPDVTWEIPADNDDIVDKPDNLAGAVQNNTNSKEVNKISVQDILCAIWLIGVSGIVIYSVVDYIRLRHLVKININIDNNVYCAEKIKVPFLLGVFRPRIYLPINIEKEQARWIIEHENTHIYRMDPVKKVLVYMITCVHWFNPIVWLGFWFFGKDMEMACDEETVKRLGEEHKQEYATVLLGIASKKGISKLSVFPAFGGGEVKERICNVLKSKKAMSVMSAVVVLLAVAMAMVFLTDGKVDASDKEMKEYQDAAQLVEKEEINSETEEDITEKEGSTEKETTEMETSEPVEKVEFTAETLLRLYEERSFVDEFIDQGWEDKLKYSNFVADKDSKDSLIWLYRCPIEYKGKNFELQVYYTVGKDDTKENMLDSFAIRNVDYNTIYTFSRATNQQDGILAFLEMEYVPEYYMEVEIPKILDEEDYEYTLYENTAGFIYDKDYREVDKSDNCPVTHYAPAGIGKIVAYNRVDFDESGKLSGINYFYYFSQMGEDCEYIEGCQYQAMLCTIYTELFITKHENGRIINTYEEFVKDNGREPEKTEMEYWYVFLAEPDEEYCYYVYLNKDYFTKEDAIKMAQSARIVDWE